MDLTEYGREQFAKVMSGEISPPENWYVVLFTGDPTDSGSFDDEVDDTETTGDDENYARQAISADHTATGWTDPESAVPISNQAAIEFPAAEAGASYSVTHFGLADAASGGNLWMYDEFAQAKPMTGGDHVEFAVGDLSFSPT